MNRPRLLLIGKVGQVGWELRRTLAPFADVHAVDFPEIDLTQPEAVRALVRGAKPRIIVNAAAYTAVDKAESETAKANAINGEAPGLLAREAKALGALMVHYSTDYVFDGTKQTPYVESDAPNPLGAYGKSKLLGDQGVQSSGADHLIFRLCWVYGARGQNFMLTMMRLAREREKLRVVSDQLGCPSWSRLIAETTALALKQAWAGAPGAFNGCYHLAASGSTSWHGFADRIVSYVPESERKCTVVEPISTAEYPLPARRPAYSVLDCGKLERVFGLRLPPWEESLAQVLEK